MSADKVHNQNNMKISKSLLQLSLSLAILFFFIAKLGMAQNERGAEEIDQLITFIKISNCTFNRNGRWYDAEEAADHLKQKYRYAEKKGLIKTAEDFIRFIATKSSISGKPYLVQCAGENSQESAEWLTTELRQLREKR
jgi:hypothetical protein